MEYQIECMPRQWVVYQENQGPYGSLANFQLMENFKKWIAENHLTASQEEQGILALALDDPSQTVAESCRYQVQLATEKKFPCDFNVKYKQNPAGKYAVFKIPHTSKASEEFWQNLPQILEETGLKLRPAPIIERYKEPIGENYSAEFLLPVK